MSSEAVIAGASVVNLMIIGVLALVTHRYVNETKRIADTTREQTAATERMAEGVLRPVILQWLEGPRQVQEGHFIDLAVEYQNIGSGPAVNIEWTVTGADREWRTVPQRVGMGVRELQGRLFVRIVPQIHDVAVVARYEDVAGARWESILHLVERDGQLVNGETRIRRLH